MSTPYNLDGIRVQTARMLEIYSLLRSELDGGNKLKMPPETRSLLQQAVDTIAENMAQLAAQLSAAMETPSAQREDGSIEYPGLGHVEAAEAHELEEILDAVLKWHAELIQNDVGG